MAEQRSPRTLLADDFDLPTTDFDSDNDEARAVPKRNDEEKWTELCLDDFEPLAAALPAGLASAGEVVDLRNFVRQVSEVAVTNPLLCRFARRLSSSATPLHEPIDDAEMYHLAHYCLLLDAATQALATDPARASAQRTARPRTLWTPPRGASRGRRA